MVHLQNFDVNYVQVFYYELHCTVNVWNPNVRYSDNTEIRTKTFSVNRCSDFERSVLSCIVQTGYSYILQSIDQNSNVWTPELAQKRLKSEQICSDFRRYTLLEVNWNQMMDTCLKSERVRILDVYCSCFCLSCFSVKYKYANSITGLN